MVRHRGSGHVDAAAELPFGDAANGQGVGLALLEAPKMEHRRRLVGHHAAMQQAEQRRLVIAMLVTTA